MDPVSVNQRLDTCYFNKDVKDDLLPYSFNLNQSTIEVQLDLCNAVVQNRAEMF